MEVIAMLSTHSSSTTTVLAMCVHIHVSIKKNCFFQKSVVFDPRIHGKVYFLFGYSEGKVYICTIKIIGKV